MGSSPTAAKWYAKAQIGPLCGASSFPNGTVSRAMCKNDDRAQNSPLQQATRPYWGQNCSEVTFH